MNMTAITVGAPAPETLQLSEKPNPMRLRIVRRDVRRYNGCVYASRVARDLGFGLGFALFVEVIFFLPGLGDTLLVSAYINQDGALTAGVLVCASIIARAASPFVDVVCVVADARCRSF